MRGRSPIPTSAVSTTSVRAVTSTICRWSSSTARTSHRCFVASAACREDKALQIARQLCAGLAAAHEEGILHRDLKPANVMIDGRGRAKITDFGLAALSETVSGAEAVAGTPGYMAPEQLAGREVTVRSDIYALGLVLYELFTGKRVFKASSLSELRELQESSTPATPSSHVSGIDPAVERGILRCLER